jgi:hypothetical protein
MPSNVVRIADSQGRGAAPPKSGSRVPRRSASPPPEADAFSVVVEVRPPDLVCLTMTRALWSVLADWMASQHIEMTIVPPPRPSQPEGQWKRGSARPSPGRRLAAP